MTEGDTLTKDEPFDCGEGDRGSKFTGIVGKVEKPLVTHFDVSFKIDSKFTMSARNVKISAPGVAAITLNYPEGKVATRQLSAQRITFLEQFCKNLENHKDSDLPLKITIETTSGTRGNERADIVKSWLLMNILDTKRVMYEGFKLV